METSPRTDLGNGDTESRGADSDILRADGMAKPGKSAQNTVVSIPSDGVIATNSVQETGSAPIDLTEAHVFLDALFGNMTPGEFLLIWTLPNHCSTWFADVDSAIKALATSAYDRKDIYAGVCTSKEDLGPSRRGEAASVASMGGLWADIDTGNDGHRKQNYPPTFEDAMAVLSEFPKPSIINRTGHGIHAYWLFRERFLMQKPADNAAAAELAERWQAWLRAGMQRHGWTLDSTFDLARVLRVPGTCNFKNPNHPLPVTRIDSNGVQYDWLELSRLVPDSIHAGMRTMPQKSVCAGSGSLVLASDRNIDGNVLANLTRQFGKKFTGSFERTRPLSSGDQSPSAYDASLAAYGARAELDDQTIADLIITSRKRAGQDLKLRQDYYARTIRKVRETSPISEEVPTGTDDPYAMQKDYGHALVLGRLFANRFRWAIHRGSWMEYAQGVWRPASEERTSLIAADTLRQEYTSQLSQAKDKQRIDDLTGRIRETCVYARVSGALAFLKGWADIMTGPEEWDKDPWLLNVANGTIDLRTGELRPHEATDLLTRQAQVNYNPEATSAAWAAHLQFFLPEPNVRRQVQRSLGVALVGTTLEEKLDLWYGTGANGKTTTARVLMAICGDYALRAAADLLIDSKHERHPAQVADLAGSRVVFSVETDDGKKMAEALVKDLTGGDRKKARYMYRDFFEFEQTFSIVLITNHKPSITGTDTGIWRRIRLVPWEHAITDYRGQRRPQEEVVEELVSGGSAVLNWLLAGLADWQSDHEWTAPEVQAATEAYRQEEDVLGAFLADYCEIGPRYVTRVGTLYATYAQWCTGSGEEPLQKTQFGHYLRKRGISQMPVGHAKTRSWKGIRVRGESQGDTEDDSKDGRSICPDQSKRKPTALKEDDSQDDNDKPFD